MIKKKSTRFKMCSHRYLEVEVEKEFQHNCQHKNNDISELQRCWNTASAPYAHSKLFLKTLAVGIHVRGGAKIIVNECGKFKNSPIMRFKAWVNHIKIINSIIFSPPFYCSPRACSRMWTARCYTKITVCNPWDKPKCSRNPLFPF